MSGTINNGRREVVSFGGYQGKAGVVDRRNVTEVAFFAKLSAVKDAVEGTIGDKPFRVLKVERSDQSDSGPGVTGMLRLTVTAVTADERAAQ